MKSAEAVHHLTKYGESFAQLKAATLWPLEETHFVCGRVTSLPTRLPRTDFPPASPSVPTPRTRSLQDGLDSSEKSWGTDSNRNRLPLKSTLDQLAI